MWYHQHYQKSKRWCVGFAGGLKNVLAKILGNWGWGYCNHRTARLAQLQDLFGNKNNSSAALALNTVLMNATQVVPMWHLCLAGPAFFSSGRARGIKAPWHGLRRIQIYGRAQRSLGLSRPPSLSHCSVMMQAR